jgi:hypothetical protein
MRYLANGSEIRQQAAISWLLLMFFAFIIQSRCFLIAFVGLQAQENTSGLSLNAFDHSIAETPKEYDRDLLNIPAEGEHLRS